TGVAAARELVPNTERHNGRANKANDAIPSRFTLPSPPLMPAALLLIDVQSDFLPPAGALAVPDGDAILPFVHRLLDDDVKWSSVYVSQDFHPAGHISFASRHAPPAQPFDTIAIRHPICGDTIQQELWPDHCVQGTPGCAIEEGVATRLEQIRQKRGDDAVRVVQKGRDADLDAYSAFALTLGEQQAGLDSVAESRLGRLLKASPSLDTIVVAGLALDFCVQQTIADLVKVRDSLKRDWRILVVEEAVRGVDPARDAEVKRRLEEERVEFLSIDALSAVLA
ncbi:hypothetical protein BMF94_0726, partial [Rhodotorula taiwanensis]